MFCLCFAARSHVNVHMVNSVDTNTGAAFRISNPESNYKGRKMSPSNNARNAYFGLETRHLLEKESIFVDISITDKAARV